MPAAVGAEARRARRTALPVVAHGSRMMGRGDTRLPRTMRTHAPITRETSVGPLTADWGINRWILVETATQSAQRQVDSRRALAQLLADLGLPAAEARTHADALWHARPKDAGLADARPGEELWRATGLPAWGLLLVLAAVVALFVAVRVVHLMPPR